MEDPMEQFLLELEGFIPRSFKMKPTWKKIILTSGKISPNCKCLICGKEFTFLGDGHFNMRLVTCPTCNQQVWVPKCLNGCKSFIKEKSNAKTDLGNYILTSIYDGLRTQTINKP
jgi:hypothetical protein